VTRLLGFRRFGADLSLQSKDEIGTGPFFAFCGLGNPDAFLHDLRNWGLVISGQAVFPDHHRYTERDLLAIKQAAKQARANALVTTEKDAQNLPERQFAETPVYICVIDLVVSPEADFRNVLDQMLAAKTGAVA
jgi:tetraacyldisaccharide 4'-kinase